MVLLWVLHEIAGTRTNPNHTTLGTPKNIWGISFRDLSVVRSFYRYVPLFPYCISDVFPRRIVMCSHRSGRVCDFVNEYVANVLGVICGKQVAIDHNCRQMLATHICAHTFAVMSHVVFDIERFVEPRDVGVREFLPTLRNDLLKDFTRLGVDTRFPSTSGGSSLTTHDVFQSSTTSPMR